MLIRKGLELLNITDSNTIQEVTNFINKDQPRVQTNVSTTPAFYNTCSTAILATLLTIPEIKFAIKTYRVPRGCLSNNNLTDRLKHKDSLSETEEREQLKTIIHILTNYNTTITQPQTCTLYIISSTSGHTLVKDWLIKAGYPPVNTEFEANYTGYKADLYIIQNSAFLITNDLNVNTTYTKILGWFPVIFKEAFKDLKNHEELYQFYKKCYTTGTIDYNYLAQLNVFKNIKNVAKNAAIDAFLKSINEHRSARLESNITATTHDITNYETELRRLYTRLSTLHKQRTFGTNIADLDLIAACLKNNPNIQKVTLSRGRDIVLKLFGPVDYDKTKIKTILKNSSKFKQWLMSHPDYTLYWESTARLDTVENRIYTDQSTSSLDGHIRNTHWHRYNCFGNNRAPIEKALANEDFLSAIMQTITAAQLLNIYDYTVLSSLLEDLTYQRPNHKAFINLNTKQMLSTNEMTAIFKKEKENENNAEQNNAE